MKKLNKVAMLLASAALASAAGAQTIDNWRNGTGDLVWKNGTNELCWRDANWTPATAAVGCDGAIVAPKAAPAPAPAPAPKAAPAPAPKAAAPAPAPAAATKVTYAADAFFDFDKAVLKAEGKAKPLATKISDGELATALIFGVLPLCLLPLYSWLTLLPVGLVWWWFSAKIKSRIGGYTGDCLGAMQQLTEVTFYVALLATVTFFHS